MDGAGALGPMTAVGAFRRLLSPRALSLRNVFLRGERRWLYLGLVAVGLLFWLGLFIAVWYLVGRFWEVEAFGPFLARKLLEMLLASLFVMLAFSNVITALSTYYLSDDLELVLSLPVGRTTFHYARLMDTLAQSSWMMALFGVPVFLAYGLRAGAGWTYFVALLYAVPAMLVMCAAVGITVATVLVNVFPARRTRELMVLLGVMSMAALFIMLRSLRPERLVSAQEFETVASYLAQVEVPAPAMFPPTWDSAVLSATLLYAPFPWNEAVLLGTGTLASLALARWTTAWGFDGGWARAQEARSARLHGSAAFDTLVAWLPGAWRPIVSKELRVFVRDPAQWSQVFLLIGICGIYLVSVKFLPLDAFRGPLLATMKQAMSFLNLGMGGFVMAAIATRFQFAAVSREGRAWWIIRGAPIHPITFLYAKGVVGLVPTLSVGLVVVVGSRWMLGAPGPLLALEAVTTVLLALAISGLAIAMGAIWPDFKADSAARAATGPAAVFFMVVALVLVFLVLTLEAAAFWAWWSGRGPILGPVLAGLAVALCLAAAILPLRRAGRVLWESGLP